MSSALLPKSRLPPPSDLQWPLALCRFRGHGKLALARGCWEGQDPMSEKIASRMPRRVHRRWLVCGMALTVAMALTLSILEIAVRLFSNEGESLLVKDERIGQRYRPDFEGQRFVPEASRVVKLRFNRQGFRGSDRRGSTDGSFQISVLGDSFVAAIGVNQQETMVEQLEKRLNAAAADAGDQANGSRYSVANYGVSGMGTAQELLVWRHYAKAAHPDLVILCFYNGNDLSDNCERLSTANRPYFTLEMNGELKLNPMSTSRSAASRWLADHSQFYVWQRNQMRLARDRLRSWSGRLPPGFEIFRSAPAGPFLEAWRVTEALLRALRSEVEATGAQFVIVQIPCHEQIFDHDWQKLLATVDSAELYDRNKPESELARICQSHGIRRIPLLEAMRAAEKDGELHFPGNGHWNDRGNAVAAAALARALCEIPEVTARTRAIETLVRRSAARDGSKSR